MKTILMVILSLAAIITQAQDFASLIESKSVHKFGLGLEPLSGKIGMRGKIKRFLFEADFVSDYKKVFGTNVYYYDAKVFFVLREKPAHRFYAGGGLEFVEEYYGKENLYVDGYISLVPLGIEIFPSERAPNLAITLEGRSFAFVKWSANFGIFYYLK